MTCPLCVQWRCSACKDQDCDYPMDDHCGEFEPYWPDGSVAVITQDEYCDHCSASLADYERQNRGMEPF